MLILYLVFQVIGARKKNRQIEEKRRKSSESPEPVGATHQREPELDEALQEIRRALGFPDVQRETPRPIPPSQGAEMPTPTPKPTPAPEPRTVERRTTTVAPAPRPAPPPPAPPTVSRPQPRPEPVHLPSKPGRVSRPGRPSPVAKTPSAASAESGGGIYSTAEKRAFRSKYGLDEIDRPLSEDSPRTAADRASGAGEDTATSDLSRRLKDPSTAREAFLLKEILDRPRALRRLR